MLSSEAIDRSGRFYSDASAFETSQPGIDGLKQSRGVRPPNTRTLESLCALKPGHIGEVQSAAPCLDPFAALSRSRYRKENSLLYRFDTALPPECKLRQSSDGSGSLLLHLKQYPLSQNSIYSISKPMMLPITIFPHNRSIDLVSQMGRESE